METTHNTRWAELRSWRIALGSLVPLWLFAIAITAEGFPHPPIPGEVAIAAFALAISLSAALFLKRWMPLELLLYSLFPFILVGIFDEISTTYKTPFILVCALSLTAGAVSYQRNRSTPRRWLILLLAAAITYLLAWHATLNFWQMTNELGYGQCFPDYHGCAPLTGQETPWWKLVFSIW